MVAQLGQEGKAGYEIGHLLPHMLKLHQQAWFHTHPDFASSLSTNLNRMADDLAVMQESALAALARDIERSWRKCFLSPEHLAWLATSEVASHLAGRTAMVPLSVLPVIALDNVFSRAYDEPECRPTLSEEEAARIIRNGRAGDLKSRDFGVIRAISEAIVPPRRYGKTHTCRAARDPQDLDGRDRQLARMTLENVSSLFLHGCFIGDPSKPVEILLNVVDGGR